MRLEGCRVSAARLCLMSGTKSNIPRWRRSSFLSDNTQLTFFPSSFSILSEFMHEGDVFAQSVGVCTLQPGQSPANPPIPESAELTAQLAHTVPFFGGCCLLCPEKIYGLLCLHFQGRLGWHQQFPRSSALQYKELRDFWTED